MSPPFRTCQGSHLPRENAHVLTATYMAQPSSFPPQPQRVSHSHLPVPWLSPLLALLPPSPALAVCSSWNPCGTALSPLSLLAKMLPLFSHPLGLCWLRPPCCRPSLGPPQPSPPPGRLCGCLRGGGGSLFPMSSATSLSAPGGRGPWNSTRHSQ